MNLVVKKNENKSIYDGEDRFFGTPVPKGYVAVYVPDDGVCPGKLILEKIKMTDNPLKGRGDGSDA